MYSKTEKTVLSYIYGTEIKTEMINMKSNIAENIKSLRKEKKYTQEQLAEAMGVSVGAVSKWEIGSSVPELGLIMELADFFETSVDSLLGYKMQNNSIKKLADRIRMFYTEKNFEEGCSEVEKALQKYPNNFDIIYRASTFFFFRGTENHEKKYLLRAKELLEHSLDLIDQPHEIDAGRMELYNDLSGIYSMLGENEKGLDILKEHNEGGIFDAFIGYFLSTDFKKYDDALPYLSDSLVMSLTNLFYAFMGFANVYEGKGNFQLALDAMDSLENFYASLRIPEKNSYLDKSSVLFLVSCAQICEKMNNPEGIRKYLKKAKNLAESFDSHPDYTAKNIKFYCKETPATSADDIGETTFDYINNIASDCAEAHPMLYDIWKEMRNA